jgi:replicative DNA helicase
MSAASVVKEQPQSLEAEQMILGAVLYENAALEYLPDTLKGEHFHEPFHGRLFDLLASVIRSGVLAEPIMVEQRLKADPAFVELGGVAYLADMVDAAPPMPHVRGYGRTVLELALRRNLIRVGQEISTLGDQDGEVSSLMTEADRLLAAVVAEGPAQEAWFTGAEVITAAISSARARSGAVEFCSGLTEVDELIGGFGRGELAIIAGRPGMAKSVVASALAKANARKGKAVGFFSQEMGKEQLGLRLACDLAFDPMAPVYMGNDTNPKFDDARKNRLNPEQWERLEQTVEIVRRWPIHFDVRPALTVSQIEACARRLIKRAEKAKIEPGPVIIDHLGIIRPEKDRKGSMHAETADKSRALAEMAKRLDVPVIALCQLNRGVEGRGEDRRPELRDLRNAGEIEEDARLVVFLYRPEYYLRPPLDAEDIEDRAQREAKLEKVKQKLFWIVAKANNGPLGQVETFCNVGCAAVRDRRELWNRR